MSFDVVLWTADVETEFAGDVTFVERSWRIRIHDSGTTNPTNGTVDFTFGLGRLTGPPPIGGAQVRPLDGKAEQVPYWIEAVDLNGTVTTGNLFSAGRPVLLGRLAEVQVNEDGGGFQTVDVRRITDIRGDAVPRYRFELSDEPWVGRDDVLFETTVSNQLFPVNGLPETWFTFASGGFGSLEVTGQAANSMVQLTPAPLASGDVRPRAPQIVAGDLKAVLQDPALDGNFRNLRLLTDDAGVSTVHSFNDAVPGFTGTGVDDIMGSLFDDPPTIGEFWVRWLHSALPDVGTFVNGRLTWQDPGIPTTQDSPYLVGGSSAEGLHPAEVLQAAYEGDFGGTPVRYDPAAIADLQTVNLEVRWFRIDAPTNREVFLLNEVYRPHLIIPFIDSEGRIRPRRLVPPPSLDPETLFHFDAATTVEPPTWENVGREVINRIVVEWNRATLISAESFDPPQGVTPVITIPTKEVPVDGDTIDSLPARQNSYTLAATFTVSAIGAAVTQIAAPVLDAYQDGGQLWRWTGHTQSDAPVEGDPVVLDCSSLRIPNPATGARSGKRVVVVTERRRVYARDSVHYEYTAWGPGPAVQP